MIDTAKRAFLKMWNGLRIFWAMTALPLSSYDEALRKNTRGVFSFAGNLSVCLAFFLFSLAFRFAVGIFLAGCIGWALVYIMGW